MAKHRLIVLVAALGASVLSAVVPSGPAGAATYLLDPAKDIAAPALAQGPQCTNNPNDDDCENLMIDGLNRARTVMGQPEYNLPPRFKQLTGPEQILVLANLDRKLYGRGPIDGFNPVLNRSAQRAAPTDSHPEFVPVGGYALMAGGGNWAGGMYSPLFAYFLWMYADAGALWQHRHNFLLKASADSVLAMGFGYAIDNSGRPSWTTLFEVFAPGTVIEFVPTVVRLTPIVLPGAPGVQINGTGFVHVTGVTFSGTSVQFKRVSATEIQALPTSDVASLYANVRVTTKGGTSPRSG